MKLALFDFDGTLVDSAYDYAVCFQTLAKEWDAALPLPQAERIRSLMFEGIKPQLEYVLGPLHDDLYMEALEKFREICLRTPLHHTSVYPGVLHVLEELESKNIKMQLNWSQRFRVLKTYSSNKTKRIQTML